MIYFAVIGHNACTNGDFRLTDLPGGAGRMDLLCRCVSASLFLSHGIRKDVICYLLLLGKPDAPKTIRFDGSCVKYLSPDERNIASHIQKALSMPCGSLFRDSSPGIAVRRGGLIELLSEHQFVILDEGGKDVRMDDNAMRYDSYLLSDHGNFTSEEEEKVKDLFRISLGPCVVHADHAIVLLHNERDRAVCVLKG